MSNKPPTFKIDDDKDVLGRLCALSWFNGVLGEYELLVNVGEDDARDLVAKLTAWLDAPRLAARETAEVVASFEHDDGTRTYLVRTPFEWGVGNDCEPGSTWSAHTADSRWTASEGVAREVFCDATNTSACELCGTYRDDHDVDEDGIYTCTDEHKAACAKKGPTP